MFKIPGFYRGFFYVKFSGQKCFVNVQFLRNGLKKLIPSLISY